MHVLSCEVGCSLVERILHKVFAGYSIDIVDEWLVVDNVVGQQVKKVLDAVVHRNNEKKCSACMLLF